MNTLTVEQVRGLIGELDHILEYWNGNANERAMYDALEEILATAVKMKVTFNTALAQPAEAPAPLSMAGDKELGKQIVRMILVQQPEYDPYPIWKEEIDFIVAAISQVRKEAFEEAARVCEGYDGGILQEEEPDTWGWHQKDYAKAIRALAATRTQVSGSGKDESL